MTNFNLYSHSIPVKGFCRSLIYDLGYSNFLFIPNNLFFFLTHKTPININEIINENFNYKKQIIEYFDYLEENKVGSCTVPYQIINISLNFFDYSKISNSFIILKNELNNIQKIISQLSQVRCKNLDVLFLKGVKYIDLFMKIVSKYEIISISLYIDMSNIKDNELKKLYIKYPEIHFIVIYNSNFNKNTYIDNCTYMPIYYTENNMSAENCGKIQYKNMIINIKFFTESLHHNTCLNRKLCIDENGDIKNCPAMDRSFGNIKDTTLEEAINKPGFKDLWDIKKDDIDVCNDCEFRYMCTDCRAFIKDPNNIYSQPAKCTYNPYIAKWKGQEGWISVEEWRAANPEWEKDVVRMIPGKDYYK